MGQEFFSSQQRAQKKIPQVQHWRKCFQKEFFGVLAFYDVYVQTELFILLGQIAWGKNL